MVLLSMLQPRVRCANEEEVVYRGPIQFGAIVADTRTRADAAQQRCKKSDGIRWRLNAEATDTGYWKQSGLRDETGRSASRVSLGTWAGK